MPHTKNTRFSVADFMKKRKEARQKVVEECRVLKHSCMEIRGKLTDYKQRLAEINKIKLTVLS